MLCRLTCLISRVQEAFSQPTTFLRKQIRFIVKRRVRLLNCLDAGMARTSTAPIINPTCTTPSTPTTSTTPPHVHQATPFVCHRSPLKLPGTSSFKKIKISCLISLLSVLQTLIPNRDTAKFNSMWPAGTPSPFVWSFEGNGYGTHADYMFGWKGDSLQRAMDKSECFYDGCGSIEKQPMATANQCTVPETIKEDVDGCEFSLSCF